MSLFYFKNFNFSLTLLYEKQLYICQRNNNLKHKQNETEFKKHRISIYFMGIIFYFSINFNTLTNERFIRLQQI